MSVAPRIAERLLEALCPPSPFRDGIVGDLAEEYAQRRGADGRLAARAWYYRQALASAPHLLGHWAVRVTFADWITLVAFGVGAMAAAPVAILAMQTATVMWMGVVPDSLGIVYAAWRDARDAYPIATALLLNVPALVAVVAGWLIGRRHREAPIAAAGTVAVTSSLIAVSVVSLDGLPLVIRFWLNLTVWTVAMIAGAASVALIVPASRVSCQAD